MTTIVLVVIGILLAAVSALMVVWWGGSSFNAGSDKAHADTLHNAGLNIVSAYDLFRQTNGAAPADVPAMISANTLRDRPAVTGIGTASDSFRSYTVAGKQLSVYVITNVSDGVCRRVNHDMSIAEAPGTDPSAPFGCIVSATASEGDLYYAVVDSGTTGASLTPQSYTFPNYATCAGENGTCTVTGTQQVRFGANGSYITKTVTGSIACTNDAFGGDPAYGTLKSCSYADGSYSIPVAPTVPAGTNTPADLQLQADYIKWAGAQAPILAAHGQQDEVPVGDGYLFGGANSWGMISSTLYKPGGGKFSSGPYVTLYINAQPYDPFCVYWASISHPGMSNCDNWYGNHIVVYL